MSETLSLDAFLARDPARVVLDVRPEEVFAAGHVPGSGNVPDGAFRSRRSELPPRRAPVIVVACTAEQARTAAAALEALGFQNVARLDRPLGDVPGADACGPGARLWRPAPFLEEVLPLLPRGRAADLAAGAGRDAVFLAVNGFEVEAWDSDREALRRATALAGRNCARIETVVADLERAGVTLPEARYQVICCFRFLHRPLLPRIVDALAPGGCVVYETYRVGQERFGKPKRSRHLLQPGELARAFAGLEVLRSEEPEPPGGPVTARILARRPA